VESHKKTFVIVLPEILTEHLLKWFHYTNLFGDFNTVLSVFAAPVHRQQYGL
jgi:hypothetical protein